MANTNKARVLLCGLVAGIVVDVFEGVTHGVLLVNRDAEMMARLGLSPVGSTGAIAALNVWGFAVGMLMMAIYAAIRPKTGAGPRTAVRAGIYTWAGVSVLGSMVPGILGIYKLELTLINVAIELVAMTVAALAGASLYKEDAKSESASAASY